MQPRSIIRCRIAYADRFKIPFSLMNPAVLSPQVEGAVNIDTALLASARAETPSPLPVKPCCLVLQVEGAVNIAAIACGGFHNLALVADGSVLSWGTNDYGQVGRREAGLQGSRV